MRFAFHIFRSREQKNLGHSSRIIACLSAGATLQKYSPTHSLLSSIRPTHTRQHKVEIGARVALVKHGVVGHKDVRGQFVRQRRQKAVIARAEEGCAPQHGAVQRPAARVGELVSE